MMIGVGCTLVRKLELVGIVGWDMQELSVSVWVGGLAAVLGRSGFAVVPMGSPRWAELAAVLVQQR